MEEGNFRETFLSANANPDFIAAQFADVLRNLMRAVAAGDPSHSGYRAAEQMKLVMDLWARCPNDLSIPKLFASVIDEIVGADPTDDLDAATLHAARSGIKYIVETSCRDSGARGRASRRRMEFISDIEQIARVRSSGSP